MGGEDSINYRVQDFVLKLFAKGYPEEVIQKKVELFFDAYDKQKESETEELRKKLESEKRANK